MLKYKVLFKIHQGVHLNKSRTIPTVPNATGGRAAPAIASKHPLVQQRQPSSKYSTAVSTALSRLSQDHFLQQDGSMARISMAFNSTQEMRARTDENEGANFSNAVRLLMGGHGLPKGNFSLSPVMVTEAAAEAFGRALRDGSPEIARALVNDHGLPKMLFTACDAASTNQE